MTAKEDTPILAQGRWAGMALAGLLLLPMLDTAAGLASGWRPEGRVEQAGLALTLILAAGGVMGGGIAWQRGCGKWREYVLLAVASAGAWLLLEAGAGYLNAQLRPQNAFHTRGPLQQQVFHPDPVFLPGISGPTRYSTLENGIRALRNFTDNDRFRMLCIGGSSTECVYLDDAKTWPARIEAILREEAPNCGVWVGNVGISGFDTREHLRFLEESPLLDRIQVLVIQPGINDLWRYLASEEEAIHYNRFEAASVPETAAPAPKPMWQPLWTRTRMIQAYHALRAAAPAPMMQEGIGGTEYAIRRERRAASRIVEEGPDLTRGLAEYRTRLARVVQLCRNRGITPVFTTQPVLWADDLPEAVQARCWFGWLANGDYLSIPALRAAMDAYNEALTMLCAEQGVLCVSLDAMNGVQEYFYDDCHFTEAGAHAVAQHVAAQLQDTGLMNGGVSS